MTIRDLETLTIVRDPNRCGGDPILAGTRIAVHDILSYARLYEGDLERIRAEALPDLSLAQLRAAMDWYTAHQQEIDAILLERAEDYERGLVGTDATG
jgi:uncharacterized protein (DUF433 family)